MTHSPAAETSCPVPLELLALLLRCGDERLGLAVAELPEARRAALALYCFGRYHMRRLGFAVALRCPEDALEAAGGAAGRQLLALARNAAACEAPREHRPMPAATGIAA